MHFALASKNVTIWIMEGQRVNGHTVSRLTVHLLWSTKYRYSVLEGDVKRRCRTLLIQMCEAEDIEIYPNRIAFREIRQGYFFSQQSKKSYCNGLLLDFLMQVWRKRTRVKTVKLFDLGILKGVVSKDHVHMHISYRPSQSVSSIVKKMKGRSSRKLQQEFSELKKRCLGQYFWAIGYGCWSTGNITDEMVNQYLEHHRKPNGDSGANFILE